MKRYILLIITFFNFGIIISNAQESVLYNFNLPNGAVPRGSLTLSAGKLYGMTYNGGTHDQGCIFSIDTSGNNYKTLLSFNDTNGSYPWFTDLIISFGKLYGMTWTGGVNDGGCIFSIDTNGGAYKDILDFNGTNGMSPLGSLTLSGNKLYGMTTQGGYGEGVIFSIDTNGIGYKKLFSFHDTNGAYPQGSLTLSGWKLFGMTQEGGTNNDGNIFSIDTNGKGYKVLLNFNGINGDGPLGDLTIIGGMLFGMADEGGTNNDGVVFSMDTNGGGYKALLNFNDTNGKFPGGDLLFYNNILYPYILIELTQKKNNVIIIINISHPHWRQLKSKDAVLNFIRHCTYDGVSEWKCYSVMNKIEPNSVKQFKDQLLRIPFELKAK
ncbi:MAG: choice-of-anchor tandem repeat GloVer-containing protein [Bacteroidia bacterium]